MLATFASLASSGQNFSAPQPTRQRRWGDSRIAIFLTKKAWQLLGWRPEKVSSCDAKSAPVGAGNSGKNCARDLRSCWIGLCTPCFQTKEWAPLAPSLLLLALCSPLHLGSLSLCHIYIYDYIYITLYYCNLLPLIREKPNYSAYQSTDDFEDPAACAHHCSHHRGLHRREDVKNACQPQQSARDGLGQGPGAQGHLSILDPQDLIPLVSFCNSG